MPFPNLSYIILMKKAENRIIDINFLSNDEKFHNLIIIISLT